MSQKPNQHCQEEHYVDHKNSERIDGGPVRMQDDAAIHDRAVCPSDLRNLQSGHTMMRAHVKAYN